MCIHTYMCVCTIHATKIYCHTVKWSLQYNVCDGSIIQCPAICIALSHSFVCSLKYGRVPSNLHTFDPHSKPPNCGRE